jgi:hypothetical protein
MMGGSSALMKNGARLNGLSRRSSARPAAPGLAGEREDERIAVEGGLNMPSVSLTKSLD